MEEGYNILAQLSDEPSLFWDITGLRLVEFRELAAQVESALPAYERFRRWHTRRKRAPGAGRKPALTLAQRLLMFLIRRRLPITHTLLGCLFNVDETTALRNIKRLKPLVKRFGPLPDRITVYGIKKFRNLDKFFERYPALSRSTYPQIQIESNEYPFLILQESVK